MSSDEIRQGIVTPPVKSRRVSLLPGCLHRLSREEEMMLFTFWEMLFEYFELPSSEGEKRADLGKRILEEIHDKRGRRSASTIAGNKIFKDVMRQTATDDPDTLVLRFLRARKWNLVDAFVMITECAEWRYEEKAYKMMLQGEETLKEGLMELGKGFIYGEDREGRLVCYVRAKCHDKNFQSLEESMTFTLHWLESGRCLRRFDEQLVTIVVDLQGAGISCLDLPYCQFMIKCLQAYYPEILGMCLILNAPWFFHGFWKVVKGFFDPVVVAKFIFIKNEELTDYIDPDHLPIEFTGGRNPFKYVYKLPDTTKDPVEDNSKEWQEHLEKLSEKFILLTSKLDKAVHSVHPDELETIARLKGERDAIKEELRGAHFKNYKVHVPGSLYNRWGIMDGEGRIVWSKWDTNLI